MFENIIGQEKVKKILENQIRGGKIAHAYIFVGQEGVGKRFCALEFAKILNCLNNDWTKPEQCAGACQKCQACLKISKNIHPDIHFIDFDKQAEIEQKSKKESDNQKRNKRRTLGIEIAQYMINEVSKKAVEGKWKIFIIDPAEKLTPEAANCLLKTIEEPPKNTLVILIANQKETIPITIVSRAQVLFFKPLSETEIENFLISNYSLSQDNAKKIAALSQGSIERAQKLLQNPDEKPLELWTKIKNKEIQNIAICELLEISKGISKDNAIEYLDVMTDLASADFRDFPQETLRILELFNHSRSLLLKNANAQTVWDNLFLDLSDLR
jgi:DNA polymerase-3 subunit delta'